MKLYQPLKCFSAIFFCLLLLLSGLLCSCRSDPVLPVGGYDYRMTADGVFLGYPIPRLGTNPYCFSLPLQGEEPAAFSYDADRAEYLHLKTESCTLSLPHTEISVPCAVKDGKRTFFASHTEDGQITVYEGAINGKAVVLSHHDGLLYLADDQEARPIAEQVLGVADVNTEKDCFLFFDAAYRLFEYRDGTITQIADSISDAWYVRGDTSGAVVFLPHSQNHIPAARYSVGNNAASVPCVIPPMQADSDTAVYVRGTAYLLQGNDDSAYFYDLRTGGRVEMDMGGLYRFPKDSNTAVLTLSPDGVSVYLYDIDYIYRLDLTTGALALAANEAPIFEGDCVLSSMTAVTDDTVILSQGSNEYTEFVPTITVAVFDETLPDVRHEDDKIDLELSAG